MFTKFVTDNIVTDAYNKFPMAIIINSSCWLSLSSTLTLIWLLVGPFFPKYVQIVMWRPAVMWIAIVTRCW